jgi:predicted RNase H-like HicB family nuclease
MTALAEVRPFVVKSGKYRFKFSAEPEGGFSVSCVGIKGINTQGETFEEALQNALSAAEFVEQCVADIAAEEIAKSGRGAL